MQNRYSGDIGDFGKLGLLRTLTADGFLVGVNWYLTPDETHNDDGRHTGYLKKPEFKSCDVQLWDTLGEIVASGIREVRALETLGLLKANFYARPLDLSDTNRTEREALRWEWHCLAMEKLCKCNVVFVDPDNGLIVPSADHKPKSNKYVLPRELADYYQNGASVIYYQHKARRSDDFYIEQHKQLVSSGGFPRAAGMGLKFITTSQRFYFFILQPQHASQILESVRQMLRTDWRKHFELC
jgi:hypothetical protein